jgi:hypothetical protein
MMQLNGTPQSRAAFINWLRARHPRLYHDALHEPATLAGISDVWDKVTSTVSNIVNKAGEILPQYLHSKLSC